MKGQMSTQLGEIFIDSEAVAQYAGLEAMECFGIVGMAKKSMTDGIVRLLKKDSLTRGIRVAIKDNRLILDFHVIVSYGVSIMTVSENLRNHVKYKVEEFTGLKVACVNVYVDGVRVID